MEMDKTTKMTVETTTRMAPSSNSGNPMTRLSLTADASSAAASADQFPSETLSTDRLMKATPVPVPNEPNLYYIPKGLSPVYRPIRPLWEAALWLVSSATVAALSCDNLLGTIQVMSYSQPDVGAVIRSLRRHRKRLLGLLLRTCLLALAMRTSLQEIALRPSRIDTQALANLYHLPSRLSRYEQIPLENKENTVGVHYLESRSKDPIDAPFRALYVNHGFGASSLSWLPALPVLQDRLGIPIALGHDAAGFGFSDRPGQVPNASEESPAILSAKVGISLLQNKGVVTNGTTTERGPVLLMGHSMGALTTLQMALRMDPGIPKRVILVAPALGLHGSSKGNSNTASSPPKRWLTGLTKPLRKMFFDPPAKYALRRLVGRPNFWRNGLKLAWGDPNRLKDSDVLRFQWPSIGLGWEQGLLDFTQAQQQSFKTSNDRELFQQVLNLPNTTVSVIVGSNDRVVPVSRIRAFVEGISSFVPVVELDGLGHDPFEEDVERFVSAVDHLLHHRRF